jgi:hypothetical protein
MKRLVLAAAMAAVLVMGSGCAMTKRCCGACGKGKCAMEKESCEAETCGKCGMAKAECKCK